MRLCTPKWLRIGRKGRGKTVLQYRQHFTPVTISGVDRILKETYQPMMKAILDDTNRVLFAHLDQHRIIDLEKRLAEAQAALVKADRKIKRLKREAKK